MKPDPAILHVTRDGDRDSLAEQAVAALQAGRRVNILAQHPWGRTFVFSALPVGDRFHVVTLDSRSTGEFPSAAAAIKAGMRQLEGVFE